MIFISTSDCKSIFATNWNKNCIAAECVSEDKYVLVSMLVWLDVPKGVHMYSQAGLPLDWHGHQFPNILIGLTLGLAQVARLYVVLHVLNHSVPGKKGTYAIHSSPLGSVSSRHAAIMTMIQNLRYHLVWSMDEISCLLRRSATMSLK